MTAVILLNILAIALLVGGTICLGWVLAMLEDKE